jgi:predicted phage terminase large subunit-like protein
MISKALIKTTDILPNFTRTVVAIDPAVTSNKHSDETGIVVCAKGSDDKFYVLDDVSGRYTPDQWAKMAVETYYKYDADKIIAEVNNGGDLVERVIRTVDNNISYGSVRATKGKYLRAEPISALYEQNRVKHLKPFQFLEDQMANYNPTTFSGSPDRLDALVWGITELSQRTGKVNWRIS